MPIILTDAMGNHRLVVLQALPAGISADLSRCGIRDLAMGHTVALCQTTSSGGTAG